MWTKLAAGTLVIGLVAGVGWVAGLGDDATAIRPIVVTSSHEREDPAEPSVDPVREPPHARTDDPVNDAPPPEDPGSGGSGGSAPQQDDTDDDDERKDDDSDDG